MTRHLALLLTFFTAGTASANEREQFYGIWGTTKQCAREPIKEGGTKLAEPFEINSDWLRQGQLWCRLSWYPIDKRENGLFTGASAQCGEDAVRGYSLGFELSGGELTIRWDFPHKNGSLMQCSRS